MNKKYKDLSINTLIFTISSFGSKFLAFFLVPLYTAVLSTSEYGKVDLMTTTGQLLIPVLTLNVQDAVLRYTLDEESKKEDVLHISFITILVSSIVVGIFIALACFLNVFKISNNYLVFLLITFIAGTTNNTLSMYLRANNKIRVIATFGIVNTFITCVFNIIFLLIIKMGVNGYMIAYSTGTIIANLGMVVFGDVFKDLRVGKWNNYIARSMYLYSLPLIANSIAWWINNASDRYIVTYFLGSGLNGIYSIAYKIPSILSMVQTTFYSAWSVSAITEFDKKDNDGFIGNVFSLYTVSSLIVCSGIMMFNTLIAKLVYSNDFYAAWRFVPLLLVGTVFNGLGLFVGCIFTAVKNTKVISITTVTGALINTLLNFILIPRFDGVGAALATMIGYFVMFISRLYKLSDIIQLRVKWFPIIISFIVVLIQCVIASLFENLIMQIPFVIAVLIINWRTVIKIFVDIVIKRK